jgi:cytochrome P450 / NADPH-cytochrome P450 reductase
MTVPIPKPRGVPLLGHLPHLLTDTPMQRLADMAQTHGPLFRLDIAGRSPIFAGNRLLADELCDESRFAKALHAPLVRLRDLAGDGLFTAYDDEPNWGKAHRLLMPAFGPVGLRGMVPRMIDVAEQLMLKWERFGPAAAIDVADDMTRLTLDTIALCAFDYRFNSFYRDDMHPFVAAMGEALDEAGKRTRRPAAVNRLLRGHERRYQADLAVLRAVADQLIAERRRDPQLGARGDLLDLMLTAADRETGERLPDENIRHQLITFLIAGHETTSGLLSFAIWLLLANPSAMRAAREQVDALLGNRLPAAPDLAQLPYLEQVLMETLRLWPTAPAFAVRPLAATTLGGRYAVTPDDVIFVLAPALHRDPSVWDEPEAFRPERFAPDAFAALPPNSWKPFGNGRRACIGRGFAMQEAVLVLAMVLRRFDLTLADPAYTLTVGETLTLKPKGLHVHARLRDGKVERAMTESRAAPEAEPALASPASKTKRSLLILYGSNTGASEAFARRIGADAATHGLAATVAAMDAHAGNLPEEAPLVFVTASYEGEPPDNARRFIAWLEEQPEGALAERPVAVFGCGNRQWAQTWQAVPRRVAAALDRLGAVPFAPHGEADAAGDFFGDFERWYGGFWPALAAVQGREARVSPGHELRVEVIDAPRERALRLNDLRCATVIANRELVDMERPGARSKRHLEIRLPEGMRYRAGDYLAVLPRNPPATVARALAHFDLAPDALLRIQGAAAFLPVDRPIAAAELLGDYVELQQPATLGQVAALAKAALCPPERKALERLATSEAHAAEVLARRVSLLDLLERYPSVDWSIGAFLAALPPMRVRQYSIASSPLVEPDSFALCIAIVDAPSWAGDRRHQGVASSYLSELKSGAAISVAVRAGKPRLCRRR